MTREDALGLSAELGQPDFRADQLLQWIYGHRVSAFAEMLNLPRAFRDTLESRYSVSLPETVRVLGSEDSTRKFLFRLHDGQLVESVLIPASAGNEGFSSSRRTLCVSSQVGCAYACAFCASGLDGWVRNLGANEIVGQVMAAEKASGKNVDNLVFMGMGEPLANYESLLRAITILNADWGLGIGARRITVSTSGLVPQIRKLAEEPMQIRLAISLHGATDEVRSQIMPVNRRYPVADLLEACACWNRRRNQKVTFEYILIEGVNDSREQARILSGHARDLHAKVNLIPYNTVHGLDWKRPPEAVCRRFLDILKSAGVQATLRREKGHDIDAACGQLRRQQTAK